MTCKIYRFTVIINYQRVGIGYLWKEQQCYSNRMKKIILIFNNRIKKIHISLLMLLCIMTSKRLFLFRNLLAELSHVIAGRTVIAYNI